MKYLHNWNRLALGLAFALFFGLSSCGVYKVQLKFEDRVGGLSVDGVAVPEGGLGVGEIKNGQYRNFKITGADIGERTIQIKLMTEAPPFDKTVVIAIYKDGGGNYQVTSTNFSFVSVYFR